MHTPLDALRNRAYRFGAVSPQRWFAILLALLLSSVAAVLVLVLAAAWEQSRQEIAYDRRTLNAVFEQRLAVLASTAKDYAVWSEAYDHLVRKFDADWATRNITRTLHDTFGISIALVVTASNEPLHYVARDGIQPAGEAKSILIGDLLALIQRARATPAGVGNFVRLADGRVYLGGAAHIQPDLGMPPYERAQIGFVFAIFVPLTESYVTSAPSGFGLNNVQLLPEGSPATSSAVLKLLTIGGQPAGDVIWTPERLGVVFVSSVLPAVGAAAIFALAFSLVAMIRLRRAEADLRHKQKLEVVGQLAGGVAHDFNNLLTIIDGYARRALRMLGDREQVAASLGEVVRASESAATLTRQLLSFSGKRSLDRRVVSVARVTEEAAALLRSTLGATFNLVMRADDAKLCVETDVGELTSAMINVVVNARDAMPRGGEIAISIAARNVAAGTVRGLGAGRYAEIAVSDQGIGIDERTLARIFEPFFTTKGNRGGTGLGLAMVHGFAEQSGGAVWATSTVGKGSTFHLCLPMSAAQPTSAASAKEAPAGRGETILLVEDNEPLLRLTRSILEGLGYTVLVADEGIAAMEVGMEHQGPIDLVISDVVMPAMGGVELAEIMRELRPDTRVLLISGFPAGSDLQPVSIPAGIPLLPKPFQPEDLARAVRAALLSESIAA